MLLLGATGAVGSKVLDLALVDSTIAHVVAPARKPLPSHEKLLNPIVDYNDLPNAAWWGADACICTLGTTLRLAGSKEAFKRIDRDFVLAAAQRTRAAGTPCFAYNSSKGADPLARNFYFRIKGQTENALINTGFLSLILVRPSLLDTGPRAEPRPAEQIALALTRPIRCLLPNSIRPVSSIAVARALLSSALMAHPGLQIIESHGLWDAVKK